MTYKYKITLSNHVKNVSPILIAVIGFSLMPVYLNNKYGDEDFHLYVLVCTIGLLLFLVPQLIIHLRYYWLNDGREFSYNPLKRHLAILVNGKNNEFSFDDIELMERNKSLALAGITYHWMPWDGYNYSVIRLKNGQQFVVTSLLVPNLDLPIEESKVKVRKRFYCYPFGVKEIFEPQCKRY